ncbi:tripeptidyl-peptidase-like protein [Cucurbitaria berberidis CBS 394.84]|uniref:tripeptidyl-peptidase II n=1 Tax=Cucurbitaria berberidis CBS 394.84 TaxID=1168544 RepID=A0A9P4L5H9_9PLEO|nr:tripeptidyl-peptidase-like protein [Cucurbitaria berberidis CBS 394.84]KAF1842976.1 tripeptidyl-peptidase-like protein [Cucurbitaria berberidis CBS 394.84]
MRYALFTGLLAIAGVNCGTTSGVYHIEDGSETVEHLRRVPEGWNEVGAPSQDRKLHFRIAVRSENPDLFERTLMEVSTPSHPRYGQHLERGELKDLIKPRAESTAAVLYWLESAGIESRDIHNDGEWINFYAPVKRAEEMMGTSFKTYQSEIRPTIKKIRSLSYSVPKEVRSHIDMIQPTTRFGQIRPQRSNVLTQEEAPFSVEAINATCNTAITPACLADLYNYAGYKADQKANVTIGVNGFLEQYARYADFDQFAGSFAPYAVGSKFSFTSVNGGLLDQNSTKDSVEANLDVQYTAGLVAPAIKTNFYSTSGRGILVPDLDQPTQADNENEPYLDFFTYLVGLENEKLPQVLTTSYGEDEQSVPAEYARKVCDLIGQLGTRGVSVIFSSGDTGVGSACQTNDGKNTTRFLPIFPASCPYVTSVGGTARVEPEQAVDFSSGGFSDLWLRPAYQEDAVSGYLEQLGSRWEGLYNRDGRGFPDVAAQGRSFRVVDKGREISVGGTSASAPVFASVVALLNNARLATGKPALGFLNPWIYSQGYRGLNDIVNGGSTGCTGRSIYSGLKAPLVPYASWNATEGWDPVTGHGTPDFEKLLRISQSGGYAGRRGLGGKF